MLGDRPGRFLRTTRANAGWALDRAPSTRELFAEQFGALTTPISAFVAAQVDRVLIIDLEQTLPDLFG